MVTTKLNREYAFRVLGVGVVFFGMCLWALYDGIWGWPEKNRAVAEVRPDLLATNLTAEAWLAVRGEGEMSALEEVFADRNYRVPAKLINKVSEVRVPSSEANNPDAREGEARFLNHIFTAPLYSQNDLTGQFVMAAITLLVAVVVMGGVVRRGRVRYMAGVEGIAGGRIGSEMRPYSEIASVDYERWDEKGIVGIAFRDGLKIRLDGWHHSGVVEIVELLEQQRPDLVPESAEGAESSGESV